MDLLIGENGRMGWAIGGEFLMGVFVGSIVAIGGGDGGVAWVIAI